MFCMVDMSDKLARTTERPTRKTHDLKIVNKQLRTQFVDEDPVD